jgi:hypothetical protein
MKITLSELRKLIKNVIKEQEYEGNTSKFSPEEKAETYLTKNHEALTGILFDIQDLLKDYMGSDELDNYSKNDLEKMFEKLNSLLRSLIADSERLAGDSMMMPESFKYKRKLIIESVVSSIMDELREKKMRLVKHYYNKNWSEYNNALHGLGNWMTFASTKLIGDKRR